MLGRVLLDSVMRLPFAATAEELGEGMHSMAAV